MNKCYSVLLAFSLTCPLAADEVPAAAGTPAAADSLEQLVQQLDAPGFTDRQEASQKLSEAGRAAFSALERAAVAGTREVASRAVDILRTHFERGDDETKQAASTALERLSKCGNASAAQRANAVINPPPPPPQAPQIFGGINVLPLRVANAQIQIGAIRGLGGAGRRVHIRDNNGDKEVEVEEADKKTKIKAPAQGNIEVEVTEKVNGKETTRKIEAKDLADLKKKDAAAAKIYEDNLKGNGIQVNLGGIAPAANPVAPNPNAIQEAIKMFEAQIERYKAQLPNNPNLQGIIDAMERSTQRMKATLPVEKTPGK